MRLEREADVPDLPRAVELNKTFHFAVYEAAHSPILVEIIRALWLKAGPVINLDLSGQSGSAGQGRRDQVSCRGAQGDRSRRRRQRRRAGIAADINSAADFLLSRGGLAG